MKTKTLLSVDWDYFLPHETDSLDWGHNEGSPWFYETMWPLRASYRWRGDKDRTVLETLRVEPQKVLYFWNRILAGHPRCVWLSDSHADMRHAIALAGNVNVINFDAHHDCGYPSTAKYDCASWAGHFKKLGAIKDYHLVYPQWREQHPEIKRLPKTIDKVSYGEWDGKPIEAWGVFVCRSSCWMPPWCDRQWLDLRALLLTRLPRFVLEAPYITKARPFVPVELPALP